MTPESEREDALRRLLAEAVEPVEPSPGAQARLLARARAQGRKPHRPFLTRWVPAGVATALVIVGVTVVLSAHSSGGSSASTSAGSAAAGAPSQAAASPEPKADAAAPLLPEPLNSQQLSTVTGTSASAGARYQSNAGPAPAKAALSPSDLDGDGIPDPVTLQAGKLTAELSRDGSQTVDLPSLGPGARVLGVASLRGVASLAPVVFVRLSQVGATSTDTLVSVVGGYLVVLEQGGGPVRLTVDPGHGYACEDSALVITGGATPYVVSGADLVAAPELRATAAAPGKVTGCVRP